MLHIQQKHKNGINHRKRKIAKLCENLQENQHYSISTLSKPLQTLF